MGNDLITKADKMYDKELFDQALNLYLQSLNNANDSEKLYILRRIAECYFYKDNPDIEKALQYESELMNLKEGKELLREKIFYLTILAEKDKNTALKMLKEMIDEAKSKNFNDLLPEMYNTLGLFQWGTKEAEENFNTALEEAGKIKDLENYILALQNLAYLETEKGNRLKALEYLQKAMDTIDDAMKSIPKSKRKNFKESYADLYDQAANLAMDMEDFDLAMEIAHRGEKID